MDRKFVRWAPLALAVIAFIAMGARQQAAPKIGFVNIAMVMEQTPGFMEARQTFETEMQQGQQELEHLQDSLNTRVQEFEQSSVVLSPTARTERQQELQQLSQRLQQRMAQLQGQMEQRQRELLAPLEERVQAIVDGLRAERQLWAVFDISQQTSSIISADTALNITQQVITRLRADQPQ
jgi:outer membrane protein